MQSSVVSNVLRYCKHAVSLRHWIVGTDNGCFCPEATNASVMLHRRRLLYIKYYGDVSRVYRKFSRSQVTPRAWERALDCFTLDVDRNFGGMSGFKATRRDNVTRAVEKLVAAQLSSLRDSFTRRRA